MRVHVKLFTDLRKYLPEDQIDDQCDLTLPDSATVRSALETLGIPDTVPKMILVNRHHAPEDQTLAEGDVVSILRPVAGGE